MAHISNFTHSDKEIITALIVYDNPGLVIEPEMVDYLNPITDSSDLNTRLTVAPHTESMLTGQVDVYYNRLQINEFEDIVSPNGLVLQRMGATRLSDLIPRINTAMGISLTSNDYADGALAEQVQGEAGLVVVLPILSTSLIYTGSLTFTLTNDTVDINTVVTVTRLSGLNYPVA